MGEWENARHGETEAGKQAGIVYMKLTVLRLDCLRTNLGSTLACLRLIAAEGELHEIKSLAAMLFAQY